MTGVSYVIVNGHPTRLSDDRRYPDERVAFPVLPDGRKVCIRPAMALDTALVSDYLKEMPIADLRSRFHTMATTPQARLRQIPTWYGKQLDYGGNMTFIATGCSGQDGNVRAIGFVHAVVSVDSENKILNGVEIAISRHKDYRGSGLADELVNAALRWCVDIGAPQAFFIVAQENQPMQRLAERAGGIKRRHPDDPGEYVYVVKAPFDWHVPADKAILLRTGTVG